MKYFLFFRFITEEIQEFNFQHKHFFWVTISRGGENYKNINLLEQCQSAAVSCLYSIPVNANYPIFCVSQ